ncbi:type II secretion system secretin GspD [Phenylobacterium sp.]|uniref:type II secretion system secretin GspD n=1 Tax=Phenylobacterium sp. TaxID=1871053 RepID=UPI002C22BF04|nr:type II secretion system secretin GspD [Phenylobacterium sp.]HLZ77176.1 type II secretion system secretin GspD [Phenylobacterium sp.]
MLAGAASAAPPHREAPIAEPRHGGKVGAADAYTFAFQDAEITQVVQEVLGATGTAFSIDPAVSGRMSFRIEQTLTREQLLAAFEAVLETNGIALVHNGDVLLVTPQAKAKSAAVIRRRDQAATSAGYEIVAVPLAYAQPSEVAKALEAISNANGVVYTSDKLGLLLLGGTGGQLKTTMETLKIFDQSAFEDSKIRWFELTQTQAMTVAPELEHIIQGAGLVGVSVVPLRRLNGLIIFSRSGEALTEMAKWVARLDTPGKESATAMWIYRPKATSADALAKTLNSVLGLQGAVDTGSSRGQSGATTSNFQGGFNFNSGLQGAPPREAAQAPPPAPSTPAVSSGAGGAGDDPARIGVDRDTNTLIIFASSGRWLQIQRILTEIDRTPAQILIEASILEVTLSKDFEFGVDWSVLSNDTKVSSINNANGTIGPSSPGISVTFLNNNINAAVHALGSRTAVEVVSAPKIIALDGRTAHLEVGDQVPVVTQASQSTSAAGAPVVSSVDYRSTGVILTVTPRVSGDGQLTLEVSQEVSSVAQTTSSGIDSPTIQQRRFESALVMHEGSVVALGGLISSTRNDGDSGIPYLKDVPLVGSLFKSQSHTQDRSELIVLLTARILRDAPASDKAMADLEGDMHELQSRGLIPTRK